MNFAKIQYFRSHEFASPDLPGSGDHMQIEFIEKLVQARRMANMPFKITSGYRTPEHNKKVGGVKNSAHTKGLAADIRTRNGRERYVILNALMKAGFKRFGIAKRFIHVDLDKSKREMTTWLY